MMNLTGGDGKRNFVMSFITFIYRRMRFFDIFRIVEVNDSSESIDKSISILDS
jgi:hypothetical protein